MGDAHFFDSHIISVDSDKVPVSDGDAEGEGDAGRDDDSLLNCVHDAAKVGAFQRLIVYLFTHVVEFILNLVRQ